MSVVSIAAQLGNSSAPVMHARGVGNPVHAGDIIAQSKATTCLLPWTEQ